MLVIPDIPDMSNTKIIKDFPADTLSESMLDVSFELYDQYDNKISNFTYIS